MTRHCPPQLQPFPSSALLAVNTGRCLPTDSRGGVPVATSTSETRQTGPGAAGKLRAAHLDRSARSKLLPSRPDNVCMFFCHRPACHVSDLPAVVESPRGAAAGRPGSGPADCAPRHAPEPVGPFGFARRRPGAAGVVRTRAAWLRERPARPPPSLQPHAAGRLAACGSRPVPVPAGDPINPAWRGSDTSTCAYSLMRAAARALEPAARAADAAAAARGWVFLSC